MVDKVKNIVKQGAKPFLKEGAEVLGTGFYYGMIVGLGYEAYKLGKKSVKIVVDAVNKAIAKSKKKADQTPVDNNTKVEPENTQVEG